MLGDREAVATVPVKDLRKARKFYEGTLGLHPESSEGEEAVVYLSGKSKILVYESEYAGTNKATDVTWSVGDRVDETVRELKDKGVTFEHYELPDTKRQGDVYVSGDMKMAWFKDPDGNIHALVSG